MSKANVLILTDSEQTSSWVNSWRPASRLNLQIALGSPQNLSCALADKPDVVCFEHDPSGRTPWQDAVLAVRRRCPSAPIILLARSGSEPLAVQALRLGVQDYLSGPWSHQELQAAIEGCLSKHVPHQRREEHELQPQPDCGRMLGTNPNVRKLKSFLFEAAASDCTVLITGETGTGKELAAEFIHEHSSRQNNPFVCINCAAIPDSLLESELFGHAKGAFTGADGLRDGLLAAAEGGTIFLDEIGDMSLFAQAKLLRVLESKEVCRLGGTKRMQLNVRFVAATNQNLDAMVNSGAFRKDLFFRLNVVRVQLPPLRQRRDDIPLLVDHYSREHCLRKGACIPVFSEECLNCFAQYDWPGNVRELKNVLESLFLGQVPASIRVEHLPERIRTLLGEGERLTPGERDLLLTALTASQWNKSRAAAKLQWSRMTLYRKMAKYQISSNASPRFELDELSPRKPSELA
jgi:DNA-binding NtrC family response regulator